jgi:hypothetical protein
MYNNLTRVPVSRNRFWVPLLFGGLLLLLISCHKHNEPVNQTPTIEITAMSDCKNYGMQKALIDTTADYDCIEYVYQPTGILTMHHINAGFNCCPEIDTDIEVEGDVIMITEIETSGQCQCNCLFDLDLEVRDIAPGEYLIRVVEPYAIQSDEELSFTVDLADNPAGVFCVERTHYPWGSD